MKKYTLFLALTFLSFAQAARAQVSTQGTDFYVAFGQNLNTASAGLTLTIRIVATQDADVTLTFNANSSTISNIHLNAGEVRTIVLDATQRANVYSNSTGTNSNSLRVQSTSPVSVYALNDVRGSADATNVLPVPTLGTEYYHFSYPGTSGADGYLVIATEANTTVYEGSTLMATLDAGQVYANYGSTNATGKHVTSNHPVAYFIACNWTTITSGVCCGEGLYQQMVPVDAWGNTFLVPVTLRGIERVRIIASQDGTQISQTGGVIKTDGGSGALNPANGNSFTLNTGQMVELEIRLTTGGCYITSNKPIGVVSYLVGANYTGLTVSKGDPAVAWIPPIEQTINAAAIAPFVPGGTSLLDEHHVLIVTPTVTRDLTTVTIGGSSTPAALSGGTWTTGNGTDGSAYSFYSLPLTNTTDAYYFTNPFGLFALGYGLGYITGWGESYYYIAGSSLRKLDAAFYVNDVHYQDIDGQEVCSSSLHFNAVTQYAMSSTPGYLQWYINGAEETAARDLLEWDKTLAPGTYTVEMRVLDMQNQTQTISSTFTISSVLTPGTAGPAQVVCTGTAPQALAQTTLPSGGTGSYTYQWQTSADNVTWGNISGANATSYTPGVLTSNAYFRLLVISGTCGREATAPVLISVSNCVMPVNPYLRTVIH
ncbi:MAG: IgGFc-binding protein [Tannerellaceae bacterium]|jgi:hypothetical protein|nr:IgGFc-binding protein [Tannerellaceae bacterium]